MMNKKHIFLLGLSTVLSLLPGLSRAATYPSMTCPQLQWPREGLRYELEGKTTLRFAVGRDGHANGAVVQKSSGWKILDDAAISNLANCTFSESTAEGETMPTQFVWILEGVDRYRPLLIEGSCPASEQFATFKNLDKSPSNASGILLRMLVNGEGVAWRVVPEAGSLPPALVDAAVAYAQSCRYGVNPDLLGERTDATYGRVIIKP